MFHYSFRSILLSVLCISFASANESHESYGSSSTLKEPNITDEGSSMNQYQTCISCSSFNYDPNCIEIPRSTHSICNNTQGCYTYSPKPDALIRGCVGDNTIISITDCMDSNTCSICYDWNNCNDNKLKIEKCYNIIYENSESVSLSDSLSIKCPLAMREMGCFHQNDGISTRKGCMTSLRKNERDLLQKSAEVDGKNNYICNGNDCNRSTISDAGTNQRIECFSCNSRNSWECISPSPETTPTRFCLVTDSCIVGIDTMGYTKRRCGRDSHRNKIDFPNGFATCKTDLCNGHFYPGKRLKCLQCEKSTECNAITPDIAKSWNITKQFCTAYAANDQCYSFVKKSGDEVVRGCISDRSGYPTACKVYSDRCKQCSTDGCNNHKVSEIAIKPPLSFAAHFQEPEIQHIHIPEIDTSKEFDRINGAPKNLFNFVTFTGTFIAVLLSH